MYGTLNVAYSLLVRLIKLCHCIQMIALNCELKTIWMEEAVFYFKVICQLNLNLIKTSLMQSSSVLLHLNPLYMFRMQIASILRSINIYIQLVQESAL